MWAAALALHRTSEKLESGAIGGEPVSLTDFNTSRGDINDLIVEATRAIKFRGVSVSQSFSQVLSKKFLIKTKDSFSDYIIFSTVVCFIKPSTQPEVSKF